jgi:hypothetical protein
MELTLTNLQEPRRVQSDTTIKKSVFQLHHIYVSLRMMALT